MARATVSDVRRRVVTLALQCQAVERGEVPVHPMYICVNLELVSVVLPALLIAITKGVNSRTFQPQGLFCS